ncbi:DUF1772 domain-containing protein [Nocardia shimofusensis]|uniref:DUF1772 domain-containing protein n=1 Tax=Nocardia shimofusensis TaxID=228596 RepID=UPI00082C5666|nr:DUF1772 domain-containing protein [Nocardia shimofusensis]
MIGPGPVRASALLSSGLLAGAFFYGAVNVVYAFRRVDPQTRFTFHSALMEVNGVVMQALMGVTFFSCVLLAVRERGNSRRIAVTAAVLALAVFTITRLGNVPINQQIEQWAVATPPENYRTLLARWEAFHFTRTACAVAAFVLLTWGTLLTGSDRAPKEERP